MAGSFLRKIAKEKRAELEKIKKRTPQEALLEAMLSLPPVRNFRDGLLVPDGRSIIAEIKRKIPGARSWKPRLSVEKLARAYNEGGARAISVLTDEKHFGGRLGDIEEIKTLTPLPILRKDFLFDPYQVYQSRAARADAVLLIAALNPDKALAKMVHLTLSLGMTPVVEAHTLQELKRSLRAGADVILINNRDLNTLKVNKQTVTRLAKKVPRDIIVIAASGYRQPEELAQVTSDRVRAFLIGRALLEERHPDVLLQHMVAGG